MINCKDVEKLRESYLNGELSAEEEKVIAGHLQACAHCKPETAGGEEELIAALKSLPCYKPSDSLVRKTRRKIYSYRQSNFGSFFDFLTEHQSQIFNLGVALALTLLLTLNFNFYLSRKMQPSSLSVNQSEVTLKSELPSNGQAVKFILSVPLEKQQNVKSVAVVGDFNGWNAESDKMNYDQKSGAWTLDVKLKPGTYDYMYVVNDKIWIADPQANKLRDDGFGGKNSVLEL